MLSSPWQGAVIPFSGLWLQLQLTQPRACFALPMSQFVPCACHCRIGAASTKPENLCTHWIPSESRIPSGLAGTGLCAEQSFKSPSPGAGRGAAGSASHPDNSHWRPCNSIPSIKFQSQDIYLPAHVWGILFFPYGLERALLVEAGKELSWHSWKEVDYSSLLDSLQVSAVSFASLLQHFLV